MLTGLFALAILIAVLFPETPAGRWLHLHLVELPLSAVAKVSRSDVILVLIVLTMGQGLLLVGSADLALLYAVDLSLWCDALIAVSAVAASTAVKGSWAALKTRTARICGSRERRRPARSRSRRSRAAAAPANDRGDGDDARRPIPAVPTLRIAA